MLEKLSDKLKHLYIVLDLYTALNKKTNGQYNWRQQGIEAQIDALEELRDNSKDNWLQCYKEDLKESNRK